MTKLMTVQATQPTVSQHRVNVLNQRLESISTFKAHLSHPRLWFSIQLSNAVFLTGV